MADSLSGEEKLRIVLESIIRSVPKEEQCQKYNVSEDDFEAWREHLMTNGGKIFEPNYGIEKRKSKSSSSKTGSFARILFFLSIFGNLVFVGGLAAYGFGWLKLGQRPSSHFASNKPNTPLPTSGNLLPSDQVNAKSAEDAELEDLLLDLQTPSTPKTELVQPKAKPALKPSPPPPSRPVSVSQPERAPLFSGVPGKPRPEFEINAFGIRAPGRLVVFALDVSDYMTNGTRTQGKFRKLKEQLKDAISDLSVNSHFNLLLFRNLREVEMLGKTILPASPTNKGLAFKWLKDIGEAWEKKDQTRNRHYDERHIYDKPPKGAVGPWYALYCAIYSYKPDAVFIVTGDCSSMKPQNFSAVEWDGLAVVKRERSEAEWKEWTEKTKTLRLTAVKWLQAENKEGESLPTDPKQMEALALSKLQLTLPPRPSGALGYSWPWREVYRKFRSGLRTEAKPLPIVHFIVTLPDGVTWSEELEETAEEFVSGVDGKLTFYEPNLP